MGNKHSIGPGRLRIFQQRNEAAAVELCFSRHPCPGDFDKSRKDINVGGQRFAFGPALKTSWPAPEWVKSLQRAERNGWEKGTSEMAGVDLTDRTDQTVLQAAMTTVS